MSNWVDVLLHCSTTLVLTQINIVQFKKNKTELIFFEIQNDNILCHIFDHFSNTLKNNFINT